MSHFFGNHSIPWFNYKMFVSFHIPVFLEYPYPKKKQPGFSLHFELPSILYAPFYAMGNSIMCYKHQMSVKFLIMCKKTKAGSSRWEVRLIHAKQPYLPGKNSVPETIPKDTRSSISYTGVKLAVTEEGTFLPPHSYK